MLLYLDGKKCNCDLDQMAAMIKAGWSKIEKVEKPGGDSNATGGKVVTDKKNKS